jgi:hypothetical protein
MSNKYNINVKDYTPIKKLVVQRVLDIERSIAQPSEPKISGSWVYKKMNILEEENTKLKFELEEKKQQLNTMLSKYDQILYKLGNNNKIIINLEKSVEEKENYINECIDTLFMYEMIVNRTIPEISNGKSRLGF